VVLAIVAGLLALLLPAIQSARERAREAVCRNNLRQMHLALVQFAETQKQFPAPAPAGRIGGWMVALLPFLEQQGLEQTLSVGSPVATAPEIFFRPPVIYRCPRRTVLDAASTDSMWNGHYVLVRTSGLLDAPVNARIPWVSGLEMPYREVVGSQGPHADGFYFANGTQQGVVFLRNGRVVR
jgi:type II secretory pathway pseudopilin PulG